MMSREETKVSGGEGSWETRDWYGSWPLSSSPEVNENDNILIRGHIKNWYKIQFRRAGHLTGYLRSKRGAETMEKRWLIIVDVHYASYNNNVVNMDELKNIISPFAQSVYSKNSEENPLNNDIVIRDNFFCFWGEEILISRLRSENVARDFPLAGNDEIKFSTCGPTLLINSSSFEITQFSTVEEKKHQGFTPGVNRNVLTQMKKPTEYKTSEEAVRVDEGFTANIMKFKNMNMGKKEEEEDEDSDDEDWS